MHPELQIQEKLNQRIKQNSPAHASHLWLDVAMYSIVIFVMISLYLFATQGRYDIRSLSRASANVGILLIGLSFMLSGLCYFWNFADHFIIYRKQLGVIGFLYAILHAGLVIMRTGINILIPSSLSQMGDIGLISAEIAILMYIAMIIISTRFVIHEIGGQRWRQLLRAGYIAFFLSLVHMFVQGGTYWLSWLTGKSSGIFPSIGLLVFLFGLGVIVLRIRLWFVTKHTPKSNQ